MAAVPAQTRFSQVYNLLKTTFTLAEVAALCKEALEEASRASKVVRGADLSSAQAVRPRSGRRKPKTKRGLTLHSSADEAESAGNAGPYVHPEPPLPKKRKAVGTGDDSTCPTGIDITGIALVDGAGTEAMELEKVRDPPADEVRVVREYGVADKKGQRHQINRPRTVSTRFTQASVDAYLTLLTSALSRKMEGLASLPTTSSSLVGLNANGIPDKCPEDVQNVEDFGGKGRSGTASGAASSKDVMMVTGVVDGRGGGDEARAAAKNEVVGVISYTEELSKNVVRTGVPPPLPKFTKVAMWRGEDVCLNQLGAGDMK